MQDIYSNYYKQNIAPNIIPSLNTEIMKRPFVTCHVKSVNSKQWG